MGDVRVVTVVHGRHDHLRRQLRLLAGTDPTVGHVVVAVDDDGITDVVRTAKGERDVDLVSCEGDERGLPLARARNLGVRRALEAGADLVVLLDVDCLAAPSLVPRYREAAASWAGPALLCGPVTYLPADAVLPSRAEALADLRAPHPARPDPQPGELRRESTVGLFWSLSAAFTPATWGLLGGFCEEYVGYGGEDTDLGRVAEERGVDLVWVGGADAFHQYHPVSAPPVEHLEAIVRNARVFHDRWGQWPMEGWLRAFAERGLVHWSEQDLHLA